MQYYKLPTDFTKPLMIKGDSFEEIKMVPNNSLDSIISDLPYLIGFMSLDWDVKNQDTAKNYSSFFKEAFRVLKPGGKMAIFTGSINYDLFVSWARIAGFNVNPMFGWIYSSGMPHGINVVKYLIKKDHLDIAESWKVTSFTSSPVDFSYEIIVKKDGKTETLVGTVPKEFKRFVKGKRSIKTSKDLLLSKLRYLHAEYFGYSVITYDFEDSDKYPSGRKYRALFRNRSRQEVFLEGQCTKFMEKYDGYNSGLKPALEPIANLQKPMELSNVVGNMYKWGVGAYNIKNTMIPLEGMENLDVKAFIRDLKRQIVGYKNKEVKENVMGDYSANIHQGQEVGSNRSETLKTALKDIEGLGGRKRSEDLVYSGTTIRDRMSSGGGDNNDLLQKALKDIRGQTFGITKATEGTTFEGTTIADRFNSGGGSDTKAVDQIVKDLERQIVGFDAQKNKIYTFNENINDSIHGAGESKSEAISKAVKFMKSSHHIHGSTGSGVFKMNKGPKSTKKDLDNILKGTKELHRPTMQKGSGSGIFGKNSEKDFEEPEMRKLGLGVETTGDMLKRVKMEGMSSRMNRTTGTYKQNKEDGILTKKELKELNNSVASETKKNIRRVVELTKKESLTKEEALELKRLKRYKLGDLDPPLDRGYKARPFKKRDVNQEDFKKIKADLKTQTTRHDPQKHKGAIFGSADMPMDNKQFALLTFFDKMLGRYPSNVLLTEPDLLGKNYNKIFLVPKPSPREKLAGIPSKYHSELHKTVKPRRLMKHLVKLLNPPNGLCADFFAGSGTTILECIANGVRSIGIEIDETYFRIAKYRVKTIKSIQRTLW